MTTPHQPYHLEQAQQLLETGQCHFPLTWDDIAAANNLCKEQDNAS